ncbi:hypothetical protein ASF28_04760 [Methylobacterium sp. Leaf99]|jgi:hypothetical protein|uniref:hypothetical protein n=1 Tax=Methylobacterium sp. Leaf99 TaxID=1736251 RepID=UPI000700600B|nr:hypothetical protein [Methylobacterium sp. Leaf99]KQP10446.1 hypothetical protein ASF28_04760 [Methylobacterium sp. Leaf99]
MPVESCLSPDDTPVFAAHATAHIDATLDRLGEAERAAFWASVRKCYNTPYNDPKPRPLPATALIAKALTDQALTDQALAEAPERAMPDLPIPDLAIPDLPMPVAAMRGPGLGTEAHVS